MRMVINDRLRGRVLLVEAPSRGGAEEKILIQKSGHAHHVLCFSFATQEHVHNVYPSRTTVTNSLGVSRFRSCTFARGPAVSHRSCNRWPDICPGSECRSTFDGSCSISTSYPSSSRYLLPLSRN